MTEKSDDSVDFAMRLLFYVVYYGSDGKILCGDLCCLHGFHHCCTCQVHPPQYHWQGPEVSS